MVCSLRDHFLVKYVLRAAYPNKRLLVFNIAAKLENVKQGPKLGAISKKLKLHAVRKIAYICTRTSLLML